MSLSYVAEPPDEVGKLFKNKAEREAARKAREEKRKNKGSNVGFIALAPARAAFLGLVSINAFKLGTRLAEAWRKDKSKVVKFWIKFSGKEKALKEAIEKGSKAQLGVITAAAAVATATPILIALAALFKELKVPTDEIQPGIDDGLKEIQNNPDFDKGQSNEYIPKGETAVIPSGSGQTKPATAPAPGKENNTGLLIGAAALLFLLMK